MYVCLNDMCIYVYICVYAYVFHQVSYLGTCYIFMGISINYIRQFIVQVVILMLYICV